MPMRRSVKPLHALSAILAFAAVPARADSGVGVDSWLANKFDPTGGTLAQVPDENGTSWLVAGMRRTPTGYLLLDPPEPQPADEVGGWLVRGLVQIGGTVTSGDDRNRLWNRYVHWGDGFVLGQLELEAERPEDGSYAELRGSRLSGEDQDGGDDEYYEAIWKLKGEVTITSNTVVSKDGKTLTTTQSGKDAQGRVVLNMTVFDRQ